MYPVMGQESFWMLSKYVEKHETSSSLFLVIVFVFTGVAAILYECRLGCLENHIPQETQDYISALHLMFSSFKTTMYAGAIPKWLRPIIPKPWEEFCLSWDGLFKFSKWSKAYEALGAPVRGANCPHTSDLPPLLSCTPQDPLLFFGFYHT